MAWHNNEAMVKNPFGLSFFYFRLLSVLYKSYRQVMTPIDNLPRLLRQPIFEKLRHVVFHLQHNKESNFTRGSEKQECV
jgi:hypothetical protein